MIYTCNNNGHCSHYTSPYHQTAETRDTNLLHEDLRVVGDDVSVHHGAKGDVVAGRLDVLVHQLPEVLAPEAVHQVSGLGVGAAHLAGQDLGVLQGLVVDGPAGDGCATLGDGSLEQT